MTDLQQNRREFIRRLAAGSGMLAVVAAGLAGCGGEGNHQKAASEKPGASSPDTASAAPAEVTACDDYTGVEKAEIDKRMALGYVKESPVPDKLCSNCKLYIPPKPGASCGGCMLFKGPVLADAHCTYWAPPEG